MRTNMKAALLSVACVTAIVSSSCVAAKAAQMGAENAIDPKVSDEYWWGRVECGEGQVCEEVAVARVDMKGDPVEITLENRTVDSVAVQVQVETFNARDERVDRTNFQDVALAPRSQQVVTMWRDIDDEHGDKIVVRMRARGSFSW